MRKISTKLIGAFASIALVLSIVGVSATQAAALTSSQISAIVSLLQSFGADATTVANVTASLTGQPTTGTPSTGTVAGGYTFAKDLTIGSTGADVTALQQILVSGGYLTMPTGTAYGYFGSITKSALIKYQLAMGIAPAAGYFGPITRAKISGSAVSTTPGVVISGTDLAVSLSATSPMASALIAGQAAANLAEFTFTNKSGAPAVVTNVSLQRIGVSGDSTLKNVYLFSGAVRLTDSASVSAGKITFNAASGIFTVPAGSSMNISVRADIDTGTSGQLIGVALTGVTASLPVSAVYPVSGASMSIFTSTDIAKATSTVNAAAVATTITAGSLNQTIWNTSLSLSGRAVYLKSLALKVIGSIPTNSLQNVKLYVAGIQVASAIGMDMNGMITFDLSSAPYKIDSSRTIEVRADVVNGSSRTFSVSLQNASDMMLIDSNYNVGVSVALGNTQSTNTVTVSLGNVVVSTDPSLAAGDIVTGASNVALARYTVKAYGEDMKISYLQASSSDQLDNVSLYANGIQIGSTKTFTVANQAELFNLGSSLIIPAGQTVTIEIRGDIKYNGVNATTTSNDVKVALIGYTNNAQGSYSSQLSTVPSSAIEGPLMRVVGAGLSVAKNSSVGNTVSIPNTTGVKIGSYSLQANSSEAVRITNLTVAMGGNISATTSLSNLYVVVDGVATTPRQPEVSNNFSVDFSIPANSVKTVDVYADILNTSGTASTSLSVNGYGVGSNITISSTAVVGQTTTVGAGTLAVPTVNSTVAPASQYVIGGQTSSITSYKFLSSNGASTISELYFDVTGPIGKVIVDGKEGFVDANGSTTVTGLNISVPFNNTGVTQAVNVQYSVISTASGIASMQSASVALTGYKYTSGNNTVSTTTLSVSSNTMKVVAGKPSVTVNNPTQTTSVRSGNVMLARITVTADTNAVSLINLPIKVITNATDVTATNISTVKVGGTTVSGVTGGISSVGANSTATGTLVFGTGYTVYPGSPVSFDIYGDAVMATDGSISTSIASSTTLVWGDIEGSATGTGAYIYNFPTHSVSINF